MSDQIDFNFNFGLHKDWQPYTGEGGSDPFPFDGFVAVDLGGFRPYFTKDNKHPALKVHGVAKDEDAKGLRIIDDILCGGKDKKGDDLGRQFLELLHASGTSQEAIQKNTQTGVEGSITAIVKQLVGRTAYAEVEADLYEGRETTKVRNWVTKERYEQAKAIGAHRRKRRTVGAQANPGAAAGMNLGGGTATTANGTAAATGAPAGGSTLPML